MAIHISNRYKNVMPSKMKGIAQELIQSNLTSHPQNQKGKKHSHKVFMFTKRYVYIYSLEILKFEYVNLFLNYES